MQIRIKNLRLRSLIGIYDWEREHKQDVIINARIDFDGTAAAGSDRIEDTVNYKSITKRIIALVEDAEFYLVEKLADKILQLIMDDSKVLRAEVEVDKPQALRFSDSVSVTCSAER